VCKNILFAHAFCECDTTSRPFNIGRSLPIKKLQQDKAFQEGAKVFLQAHGDHQLTASTGERLLVTLYGGREDDTLDKLRLVKYQERVSKGSLQVQPKVLPPASAAARYHCFRMNYQIQEWACLGTNLKLMPEEWGWQLRHGKLFPTQTDIPPAPEDLLNVIRCNCKKGCSSAWCNCRKHGPRCTYA